MYEKNDVVIINLDRPRELRFGHKAIKKMQAMNIDIEGEFDVERLEEVFFLGLQYDAKQNNETLKMEDMEDLLDLAPYYEVLKAMELAFAAAMGSAEDDEKNLQRIAAQNKKTQKKKK
jgi:hypothetical protein